MDAVKKLLRGDSLVAAGASLLALRVRVVQPLYIDERSRSPTWRPLRDGSQVTVARSLRLWWSSVARSGMR
jgi:hypothetical protein